MQEYDGSNDLYTHTPISKRKELENLSIYFEGTTKLYCCNNDEKKSIHIIYAMRNKKRVINMNDNYGDSWKNAIS